MIKYDLPWPEPAGFSDEVRTIARMFKFHNVYNIPCDEVLERAILTKRRVQENPNVPIARIIRDAIRLENHPGVAKAYEPYVDMPFNELLKDKSQVAKDLVTTHMNVRIKGLRSPSCREQKYFDEDTKKMLDKALARVALKLEIEDIQNTIRDHAKLDEQTLRKLNSIDGKELRNKLEKCKDFGANQETRRMLSETIRKKAGLNAIPGNHDQASQVNDAIERVMQVIGDRVKTETHDGLNKTLALAAYRNEIPADVYEKCFGKKRQQN